MERVSPCMKTFPIKKFALWRLENDSLPSMSWACNRHVDALTCLASNINAFGEVIDVSMLEGSCELLLWTWSLILFYYLDWCIPFSKYYPTIFHCSHEGLEWFHFCQLQALLLRQCGVLLGSYPFSKSKRDFSTSNKFLAESYRRLRRQDYYCFQMANEGAELQSACSHYQKLLDTRESLFISTSQRLEIGLLRFPSSPLMPTNSSVSINIKRKSLSFFLEEGLLFQKRFYTKHLLCVWLCEVTRVLKGVHLGYCDEHQRDFIFSRKSFI